MNDTLLSTEKVSKTFQSPNCPITALREVTTSFRRGVSCALLGENGAGKTTLLRLFVGLARPDSGAVHAFGLNPMVKPIAVRRRVAYLPAASRLYERLTIRENLTYFARLEGFSRKEAVSRAEDISTRLMFSDLLNRAYAHLSNGQRRRVELARALIGNPEVILLDEPFSGLDISARHNLIDYLVRVKKIGMTLIISSHITTGLSELCDWVTILHEGRIVTACQFSELLNLHGSSDLDKAFLQSLRNLP